MQLIKSLSAIPVLMFIQVVVSIPALRPLPLNLVPDSSTANTIRLEKALARALERILTFAIGNLLPCIRTLVEGTALAIFAELYRLTIASNALKTYYPYSRQVPHTSITMHLRYQNSLPRHQVSELLSFCLKHNVAPDIKLHTEDAKIPVNNYHRQTFEQKEKYIAVVIGNSLPNYVTYGNLRDVLKGLGLYCANQECSFEFDVGDMKAVGWGLLSSSA